jgi:hypothetical protein
VEVEEMNETTTTKDSVTVDDPSPDPSAMLRACGWTAEWRQEA